MTEVQFISVAEVARRCDVSTRTVRRWIGARQLPAYRLGRQLRIRAQDLEIFLKLRRED